MIQLNLTKRAVCALGAVSFVAFTLFFLRHGEAAPGYFGRTSLTTTSTTGLLNDINNSTLGFEKMFVVGLASRTDRRDGMVLQAALSNMEINFVDGVKGEDVSDKAIPQSVKHDRLRPASIGSWRAHMNAIQQIVAQNLTSALIMEDDVDWDVRLRQQLVRFARSSHALIQPLSASHHSYADPTYPKPSADSPKTVPDIPFNRLPATQPPKVSPYGDDWDLLWLGHCGMHFPFESKENLPKGRVIHENDDTVAKKKYLWTFNKPFTLKDKYPEHTRAVHHTQEGVCSLGYALSQKGARKLLYEVGTKDVTDAFDILLRFYCEGTHGRGKQTCLTTQPALIHHHRPAGPKSAGSDISNFGEGFREKSSTDMVRLSVRLNAAKLLAGEDDLWDQYPDNEQKK